MKKNSLIIIVLIIASCIKSFAQQDPHYTMYMYNMNIVNPAYAGSMKYLNIGLLGREQWVGIEGAPSTYTANIHSSIGRGFGMGFSVVNDKIGPQTETNTFLDLSYTIPVSRTGNLSFGLKLGGSFFSIKRIGRTTDEESNLNNGINEFFPNIGSGIMYHSNTFYLGISAPNFIRVKHIDKSDINKAKEVHHYFATAGLVLKATNFLKIKPSTMFKIVPGSPVSVDLSLNALFYDRFEIGIANRLDDSWAGTFNILATEKLRIGYAYDKTISELDQFSRGSHEIFLLYAIPLTERKVKSPRFF